MKRIKAIAESIVAREGGYVNDPADPGGATNFGVTIGTLKRLGLDLTGDRKVTTADVKAVTRGQARDIFISDYYYRPKINELTEPVQASIFDMQVNAGANAVKVLQRLLGNMDQAVSIEGAIGPKTIRAARLAQQAAPNHFADAYGIERRNYYYSLADRRPASRKFARAIDGGKGGWIRRAEEFISARYRLSDAEHKQRTMQWG